MEGLIRVSVIALCHDAKGNYLLGKRSMGESVEDGVRREVKEETCADAKEVEFLGYRDVFREQDGKATHWLGMHFRVLIDPAQVKIGEPHKCDEQRWGTIAELEKMDDLHSQFPAAIERFREFLV